MNSTHMHQHTCTNPSAPTRGLTHTHTCMHALTHTHTHSDTHIQLQFGSLESHFYLVPNQYLLFCTYIWEWKKQQPKNKTSKGRDRQKEEEWGREETKEQTPCHSYLCKLFEFGGRIPGRGDHDLGILHHGPSVLVILAGCQTCRRVSTQRARCALSQSINPFTAMMSLENGQ